MQYFFSEKPEQKFLPLAQNCQETLNTLRQDITTIRQEGFYDLFQALARYVNPYELLPIAHHTSRAYYKMWEALMQYDLLHTAPDTIHTVHLCEAPGAFVEATCDYWSRSRHKSILWYGVSLPPSDEHPDALAWHIRPSHSTQLVHADLVSGGPLPPQLKGAWLVTGDGGFEITGEERNNQEELNMPLLKAQILQAQDLLTPGGSLFVKLFDMFLPETWRLLWQCYRSFKQVWLFKPIGSRICNSEKYVIGQGFIAKAPLAEPPLWFADCCHEAVSLFVEPQIMALKKVFELYQEARDLGRNARDIYNDMRKDRPLQRRCQQALQRLQC